MQVGIIGCLLHDAYANKNDQVQSPNQTSQLVAFRRWFLESERLFSPKETLKSATRASEFGQKRTLGLQVEIHNANGAQVVLHFPRADSIRS